MKPVDIQLEVMMAGARLSGKISRARPQHEYGDPANQVEYPAEVARKEKARKEKAVKLKKQKQKQSKHQYMRKTK